jgi:hypothetical protein
MKHALFCTTLRVHLMGFTNYADNVSYISNFKEQNKTSFINLREKCAEHLATNG